MQKTFFTRKKTKNKTRPIEQEDAKLLIDETKVTNKRDRLLFATILYSGRRVSEVLMLTWEDLLDPKGLNIYIAKQGKFMYFTRHPELLRITYECYENQDIKKYAFLGLRGPRRRIRKPLTSRAANDMLKYYFKKFKIKTRKASTHCLRKTFGVNYVRKNSKELGWLQAIYSLQQYWGHSTIDQTIDYLCLDEDMAQEKLNNVSY